MKSTTETGHVKNVQHFEDLVTICEGYGSAFQPSNADIQLLALRELVSKSKEALVDANQKLLEYSVKVGQRHEKYKDLKKLATRLVNALAASNATEKSIENAKAIQKKIQGARGTAIAEPTLTANQTDEATVRTRSTSQQSFGHLSEHFSRLILLLKTETSYSPNELDLQVATLDTLLIDMEASNAEVMRAANDLSNSRIRRNEWLYTSDASLYHCAGEVKKYLRSLYGAASSQYKQVSGIRFSTVKL